MSVLKKRIITVTIFTAIAVFAISGCTNTKPASLTKNTVKNNTEMVPSSSIAARFREGPLLPTPRMNHWQVTVSDNAVLLMGGNTSNGEPISDIELFDTEHLSFLSVEGVVGHEAGAFTFINDENILMAGGQDLEKYPAVIEGEIFNTETNSITSSSSLTRIRSGSSAALLQNGNVLIVGGWRSENEADVYGEIYNTSTSEFSETGPLIVPRAYPIVLPTDDGRAVIIGGFEKNANPWSYDSVEIYDPATNSFNMLTDQLFESDPDLYIAWSQYVMPAKNQQLEDGKYLLIAYSPDDLDGRNIIFTFDPSRHVFEKFAISPPLPLHRETAFRGPIVDVENNRAYLLGITGTGDIKERLEVYIIDLKTMELSLASGTYEMKDDYYLKWFGASLLHDGRIFITGGNSQASNTDVSEPSNKTLLLTITSN